MKDFYMEKKKKKKIIKEKRQELPLVGKILEVMNYILKIAVFIPLLWVGKEIIGMEEPDSIMLLILLMMGLLMSGCLGIVSLIIDKVIQLRFLAVWVCENHMELHLQKNGVEYGSCIAGTGDYFRTYYFDYTDIENLEFDRKNHVFRITGKYVNKTWKNVNRMELVKKHEKTAEVETVTILEYFQNFERFMEQIQEETGLNVKNTEIRI